MNLLEKALHALRVWTGLADESPLTAGHGCLLPVVADERRGPASVIERRAARWAARDGKE